MAKQTINLGTTPNDRTGDNLRVAFDKCNDNFTELYDADGEPVDATRLLNGLSELLLEETEDYFRMLGKRSDSTKWGIIQQEDGKIMLFSNNGDLLLCSNDGPVWTLKGDGGALFPEGGKVTFRRWDEESFPAGDSFIQAGEGFHVSSGEGIYLHAVDMTDPENPEWYTLSVGTDGGTVFPGAQTLKTGYPEAGTDSVGAATELSVTNTPNANWINGTGVFANGINFTVAVDGSGNATISAINDGGTGHYQGETFGPVGGDAFGGSTPDDDMYFSVAAVDQDITSAINLAEQVHVLNGSNYGLPDGANDGQIIYLVNATNANPSECWVLVTSGRSGMNVYDDAWFAPFQNDSGVVTAIFTDGAWNFSSGVWD